MGGACSSPSDVATGTSEGHTGGGADVPRPPVAASTRDEEAAYDEGERAPPPAAAEGAAKPSRSWASVAASSADAPPPAPRPAAPGPTLVAPVVDEPPPVAAGGAGPAEGDVDDSGTGVVSARAVFFPDAALPCRFGDSCRKARHGSCSYSHGEDSSLSQIIRSLNEAEISVDVCVFSLTLNELADALRAAHRRGVRVRLITDDDQSEARGSDVVSLGKDGIDVRMDNSKAHMHHKFAIVDGRVLLNGSFNWTRSAVLDNREAVCLVQSTSLCGIYAAEFDCMWDLFSPASASTHEGLCVRSAPISDDAAGFRVFFFPDAAMPCRFGSECRRAARGECTYAHDETALSAVIGELSGAMESLDICVFSLTCNEIADAVRAAHSRGVKVRLLTDDDQADARGSDIRALAHGGIEVRSDSSPSHMHCKYCIIDVSAASVAPVRSLATLTLLLLFRRLVQGTRVLTGSFNWTRSAVLNNRENVMVSSDARLVQPHVEEFGRLWEEFSANTIE